MTRKELRRTPANPRYGLQTWSLPSEALRPLPVAGPLLGFHTKLVYRFVHGLLFSNCQFDSGVLNIV